MYIVHGLDKDGTALPLVYALLPNKQESSYMRFFEALASRMDDDGFGKHVVVDFEENPIKAIKLAFPRSEVFGCIFHLSKSIQRNMSSDLNDRYDDDTLTEIQIRRLAALSFLPPSEVQSMFETIKRKLPRDDEEMLSLYSYFERTYIGTISHAPNYAVQLWNSYYRVLNDIPRTSNYAESFNRKLNGDAACDHPSIWNFIELLRLQQHTTDRHVAQGRAGPINLRRAEQLRIDRRLKELVSKYDSAVFTEEQKLKYLDCCCFALVSYSKKKTLEKRTSAQHIMPRLLPIYDALTQTLDIVDN